jgi:hypothetical protein
MAEILFYSVVFIAGGITAALYLLILHLSVNNILQNTGVSWLTFLGFFLRLFICGLCFFLCSWGGRFDRLALSFAGFILVRIIAVNFIKSLPLPGNTGKEVKK